MDQSALSDLFRPLVHIGTVQAVRQGYEVFRTAGGDYVVFSPSNRGSASFHMALVRAGAVEAVASKLSLGGVTSGSILKDEVVAEALGSEGVALRFDALMCLYVLTASGRANMQKQGRNLVFRRR